MTEDIEPSTSRPSSAVVSGIAGGVLVGLTAAVIAFVFIGPLRQYGFDLGDTLLVALLGSMFGVVAGAVAGSSDTDELEAPARTTATVVKPRPAEPAMRPAHPGA